MKKRNLIIDGLNISFYQSEVLNKKDCLIFLHGWGSEALHLKSIFENCENFVALDFPGFGKSERPSSAWSVSDYSEFLSKFLTKMEILDPVLVGHSFGGRVIIKYCSKIKDVKKIILIGSAGIRNRSLRLNIYKYLSKIFNLVFLMPFMLPLKSIIRRRFYKSIGSEDYLNAGQMMETFKNVIEEDLRSDMEKISVKAVLIWGEDDRESTIEEASEIKKHLKNSQLYIIPDAGHYVFLDKKEKFNEIFFQQLV